MSQSINLLAALLLVATTGAGAFAQDAMYASNVSTAPTHRTHDTPTTTKATAAEAVATTVLMPAYAAGAAELEATLAAALVYPAVAQNNGIEGTVVLRVRIDEQGGATVTHVIESVSEDCDAAAVAAVESLGAFTPARLRGRAFARNIRVAVDFKL